MLNTNTYRWQRERKLLSQSAPIPTDDRLSDEELAFVFPATVLIACIVLAGLILTFHGCGARPGIVG